MGFFLNLHMKLQIRKTGFVKIGLIILSSLLTTVLCISQNRSQTNMFELYTVPLTIS